MHRTFLLASLVVTALFAILVAGCNGEAADDEETPDGTPGATSPRPPEGQAAAGGERVELGLGTYCWTEGGTGLCADAIGIITRDEVLSVDRGGRVSIEGDLARADVTIARVSAWPRPSDPIDSGPYGAAWGPGDAQEFSLPVEDDAFAADLEPGEYLVNISVNAAQGDASYGLLLTVR
jgi:hypothetical protein